MRKTAFFLLWALLLPLLGLAAPPADSPGSGDPGFQDTALTTAQHHLLFFTLLVNGVTSEMIKGLHSGIPIRFTFSLDLSRAGANEDQAVVNRAFSHVLRYDTLKETYQVTLEERPVPTRSYPTLEEGLAALSEINGLKLIELSRLEHKVSYRLRFKAELAQETLPLNLKYVAPFAPLPKRGTEWQTLTFTY